MSVKLELEKKSDFSHNFNIEDGSDDNLKLCVRLSDAVSIAEKYENAYNHSMKVLKNYIDVTEKKATRTEKGYEYYIQKAEVLFVAYRTIEENYNMFINHPELFKEKE
jgi:hypothetical protein